jgi:CubicO group peptidase (beta-lactamase class C family)
MNVARSFLIPISLLLAFTACNQAKAPVKISKPVVDSVGYLPPKPGDIPKQELDRYYAEIQDYYQHYLVDKGFNGGILVAKKGHVIFEAYHGFFNLKKKDSLTPHSAFHLASVSKTFTAMATLKLVEMGKLSLDDDLKKFFPGFPYDNVTVKLLLSHRSGLPNYIYFMQRLGWNTRQYCSNEDVLSYLMQFKPPITSHAGTHFEYCNTNYALLGLIIEKASGKSYADFLQVTFFTPLHMDDTYVFNMTDSAKAMPSYLGRRQQRLTFLDTGFGDKNIYSTPEDLLKWDQALYTNEIFNKQILDAAFTPYSNEKPGIRNYGYGWRMNVYPTGRKIIYHNGWWHGNNAVFIRMIQDSATIIVLGNKFNPYIYKSKKMAEIFEPSSVMEDDEKGPSPQGNNYNTENTESGAPVKKIHHAVKTTHGKKISRRKR